MADREVDEALEADFDTCYRILAIARDELVDSALGNNLFRLHHLESAVAQFEDVKVLLRAEIIIREALDPRDVDEAPTTDSTPGS